MKHKYVLFRSMVHFMEIICLACLMFHGLTLYGGAATRKFTDMLGGKVTVPDHLNRVALLGGPTGQIVYILGARNQLCAGTKSIKVSQLVNLMDPTIKDLPTPRTTSGQVKVEELIVSDPQLVIAGDFVGSLWLELRKL